MIREHLSVLAAPPLNYVYPRLSPDNTQVALDVREPEGDIWTWDLERGLLTRVTFDPAENPLVAWSPDGRHLAFGDGRSGTANVYRQALDGGSTTAQALLDELRGLMKISNLI